MSYAPNFPSAQIPPQYATQGAPPAYNPVPQQYPPQGYPQQYGYPQQGQPQPRYNPVPPPPQYHQGMPVTPMNDPPAQPQMPNFPQTGYYNPGLPQAAPNNGYYTVRVIAGTHRGTRCIFRVGDTFRTKDPLHLMFENKFQLVPDAGNIIEDSTIVPDRMIPKTPEEVAAARLSAAMQQGVHNATMQPTAPPPQNIATPPTLFQPQTPPPVDEFLNDISFPFAESEDVSKRFPKAAKKGMEIWKHAELGYAINMIDPANPDARFNLADTELKTVTDVNKYLVSMGC